MADSRFVFRASEELLESLRLEAEKAGVTPSEFVRRAVESAITTGWLERQPKVTYESGPTQKRQLGMRVIMPSGQCLHPPTAVQHETFVVKCGLCGEVLRRR